MEKRMITMDAKELAAKLASKELTSQQAVERFIDQISRLNPEVNALVEDRFSTARKEAELADRMTDKGEATGVLHGVPISMKESFHVRGMQTTGGLIRRKGMMEQENAEIVRRLKAEGAIILGKTNTPELCFCQETDNKLYGRTNNPHDLRRTAGGSSGGEAALIAFGGAAAGIGSDIGGSIRFPSHFNGVVGFKSGKGQVDPTGSYPAESHPLQERMLGIGPIAKSVKDARLLYGIIAEKKPPAREARDFQITVLPETRYPLSLETAHLLESIQASGEESFRMDREVPPYFESSARLWQEIMSIDGAKGPQAEAFGEGGGNAHAAYLHEKLTGNSSVHKYLSWAFIGANLFKPSRKRIREIERIIEKGDDELDHYLHNRLLVFPVYHRGAPEHGRVYDEIFSIRKTYEIYMPFTAYANVWGLPSLTVPIGEDEDGMPIAVQVMSRNGNEEAIFQFGEWLEEHFRGYQAALGS